MSNASLQVAAIQMVSGTDVSANLAVARDLLAEAATQGAELAVLPENFAVFANAAMAGAGAAEITPDGPLRRFLADNARDHGMWIVGGTLPVAAGDGRVSAACFMVDPQGREVARYDKIHLFDVEVEDSHGRYAESETFAPGDKVVVAPGPAGGIGLSVCYDLRFPEMYRRLAQSGAMAFTVPAAFTEVTGAAHWEVLLRARAVENLAWVIGAGQGGRHGPTRTTWGHSMIVDPWGGVVAAAGTGEAVISAEIDPGRVAVLRERMPVLRHSRFPIGDP